MVIFDTHVMPRKVRKAARRKVKRDSILTDLSNVGQVGDLLGATVLTNVEMQRDSAAGTYLYAYNATRAVMFEKECDNVETSCVPATDQKLYQLEAHRVECPESTALQRFNFRSCASGFQYVSRCCRLQGIGGCDLTLTPWTKVDTDSEGPVKSLMKHQLVCAESSIIRTFVLEAKNPGHDVSEIRYDYMCCKIVDVLPISVTVQSAAISKSFQDFEGVYFPTGRVQ